MVIDAKKAYCSKTIAHNKNKEIQNGRQNYVSFIFNESQIMRGKNKNGHILFAYEIIGTESETTSIRMLDSLCLRCTLFTRRRTFQLACD